MFIWILIDRYRYIVTHIYHVRIVSGDKYREEQVADYKSLLSELHPDIALVCVCGNHDIGNTPTPATVQRYREDFGDDYFSFWVGGVKCIVLNSQFYEDASLVSYQDTTYFYDSIYDMYKDPLLSWHTIVSIYAYTLDSSPSSLGGIFSIG